MLRLDPANASIYANLGMVEFSQSNYAESAHDFELALARAPSLHSAKAFLGMAKVKLGASAEGQKLLEEALPGVTDRHLRLQAGLELVRLYSQNLMLDKAQSILDQLQALDPANPEVLYSLYSLHSEMASTALHRLTAANPDSAWVHEVLGRNFMAQEQYSQAVQEFRNAIDRGPHLTGLHYQLGEALLSEARTGQNRGLAEKEFNAELQADPQHTDSLLKLAEIAVENSDLSQAKSYLEHALAARPEFAEAHALSGKILDRQGDLNGAISEWEKAEKLAPEARTTHYQLAQLYRKQGRSADADREAAVFRSLPANDNVAADKVTSK